MANSDLSDIFKDVMAKMDEVLDSSNLDKAVDDFGKTLKNVRTTVHEKVEQYQQQTTDTGHPYNEEQNIYAAPKEEKKKFGSFTPPLLKRKKKMSGKIWGTLLQILGGIGLFGIGIAAFTLSVLGLTKVLDGALVLILNMACFLPLLICSGTILGIGIQRKRRVKRYEIYNEVIGDKEYCNISDLADATGKSISFSLKELKCLIKERYYPEGHLDKNEQCLILTNQMYEQYLEARDYAIKQEKIQDTLPEEEQDELLLAIKTGKEYVNQIEVQKQRMLNKDMLDKLEALEKNSLKILDYVQTHPEKLSDIRRFINYYLPTTVKLVYTYVQMEDSSLAGENILSTREEIEKTIDTINEAFRTLYDGLFEREALDAHADLSALQTILAQEGLTRTSLNKHE